MKAIWSPTNSSLAIVDDYNIFYIPSAVQPNLAKQITFNGSKDLYYGIPDWVYEGKPGLLYIIIIIIIVLFESNRPRRRILFLLTAANPGRVAPAINKRYNRAGLSTYCLSFDRGTY